ncbi:MAG: NAD(P)-dependent oxidoreductase, partial [Chloroflexi bacterium]|nr:NAD(P)-dependent oxidoreductase [Chloroflexota bacterium]
MNALAVLENATAVVTGASGFIGSHLVDYLVDRGCRVHALVRKTSDRRWLNESVHVTLHIADLTQPGLDLPFLGQADYVFHCAGLTRAKTQEQYFKINTHACRPLYERCAANGNQIKGVVHLSSLAAAGPGEGQNAVDEKSPCRPLTHYGKSKLAGEEIALKFSSSLPMVIIRPPVVYGPRETNFFTYLKAIHSGWDIRIGNARKELSLIYVHDLVRAMVESAVHFSRNENIFFVTDGNAYSWEDVAETAMQILDIRARKLVIPETVIGLIAYVAEALAWLGPAPALIDRQRVIDIRQTAWVASPKKFFDAYNFQPQYGLEKGLRET